MNNAGPEEGLNGSSEAGAGRPKKKTNAGAKSRTSAEGAPAKRGRKKKGTEEIKTAKKKFGKKGVTVTSQAREIVYNVIKHFKKEARDKCNSHPFENWLKRSVAATGLSKSTLQRIIKEVEKPAGSENVTAPRGVEDPKRERCDSPPPGAQPHYSMPPPTGPVDQTSAVAQPVRLEQYGEGLIKHFSNYLHHHHHHHHHPQSLIHHGETPPPPPPPPPHHHHHHHHDLLLQPLHPHHHHPPPPPPAPPPPSAPPPLHSHPHIHS